MCKIQGEEKKDIIYVMLLDKNICSFHNLIIDVLRGYSERATSLRNVN